MFELMRRRAGFVSLAAVALLLFSSAILAQDAPPPDAGPGTPPTGRHQRAQGGDDSGVRPVFGRIAAIQGATMRITRPDGSETTIKITDKTEFRRDREPAKLKDFKVGDGVLVRGEENPDSSVTAQMIAGRTGNGGPGGGPNRQNPVGTIGKDFVLGAVTAIDPPSITVLRTDKIKQVLELNEDTSLRKGQDSVTMADIQVGDHIFARGALQQNQFVPKTVIVIDEERWKLMQENGLTSPDAARATRQDGKAGAKGAAGENSQGAATGNAPASAPNASPTPAPSGKPTEPPN
jgi:hypothetical protein